MASMEVEASTAAEGAASMVGAVVASMVAEEAVSMVAAVTDSHSTALEEKPGCFGIRVFISRETRSGRRCFGQPEDEPG